MKRYKQTTLGGVVHLGSPDYDDDGGEFLPPVHTLCGLSAETWSATYVRGRAWSKKKPGIVCAACDRTALWETILSFEAR